MPPIANTESVNESDAFTKHLGMFTHPKGAHLIERTRPLGEWLNSRIELGTWPYSRALETSPDTTARVRGSNGLTVEGINFGSQDYLGLASHPSVHDAA